MYWWLIGGAAWYATAAVVVRRIPCRLTRDSTGVEIARELFWRLLFWLLSPLWVVPLLFVVLILTPKVKNP